MPRRRKTQPVRTTSSEVQGGRVAQERRQQLIPLPQTQGVPPAPAGQGPDPSQLLPVDAPSQRPDEPVTAGIAAGPGTGPEALGSIGQAPFEQDVHLSALKTVFQASPSEGLRRIIERMESENGFLP